MLLTQSCGFNLKSLITRRFSVRTGTIIYLWHRFYCARTEISPNLSDLNLVITSQNSYIRKPNQLNPSIGPEVLPLRATLVFRAYFEPFTEECTFTHYFHVFVPLWAW